MVTLGFLCLFMAFVLGVMFMIALATRDRGNTHDDGRDDGEN